MAPVEELRACTIDEVRASWTEAAPHWSKFVRGNHDLHRERLHGPALLDACGDVRGRRALDLGCGEGWCSRELARRGASVVGIDVCDAMVTEAFLHPQQAVQPVEYRVLDAVDVRPQLWAQPFDLVTACVSLQNMPDPAGVLRAACTVLAPGGKIICSIPHPLTQMRGGAQEARGSNDELYLCVEGYFKGAPYRVGQGVPAAHVRWSTVRWSRSLSEYAGMFRRAGLVIHDQLEPRATLDAVAAHPQLRNADQLPYYLVIVAEHALSPLTP